MFTMTPIQYLEWLMAVKGMTEQNAIGHVQKLYYKQTGKLVKFTLKPYKGELIWAYES